MFLSIDSSECVPTFAACIRPFLHQRHHICVFKVCSGVVIGGFQNFLADLQTSLPGHFQHGADVQTDILHQLWGREALYSNLCRNGVFDGNAQFPKPQFGDPF